MAARIRQWTTLGAPIGILALGLATVAWMSGPPSNPGHREAADCLVNITARNRGTTNISADFYNSQVRRRWGGITWETWKALKIRAQTVEPGTTIRRSYTAPGRCDVQRQWRWKFRKGTSNYTYTASTEVEVGNTSMDVSLGDVSPFF